MPMWRAMARSLNTVAAEMSFKVGRDKVIDLTRRLGIKGIRKSCSMALGDRGITPLEHAGGIATFANGGKLARPYGILDIVNSKGELIYSRDRDEPEAPQVIKRQVAEQMNWMMQRVVEDGTAKRAQLGFTHAVGKTGTSTGPKDVWFVGFTGKYVGVVWLGNDNNRSMSGTTGGQYAAPIWQSFMSVAHKDMNFPTIPGLRPHPVQVAEQRRIAALGGPRGLQSDSNRKRSSRLMSDAARNALRRTAKAMRKAAGIKEPETEDRGTSPAERLRTIDRRARGPSNTTFGAMRPRPGGASRRALP
jgi:penicillin-binding protein 1A